jgi:hypothetical protein
MRGQDPVVDKGLEDGASAGLSRLKVHVWGVRAAIQVTQEVEDAIGGGVRGKP